MIPDSDLSDNVKAFDQDAPFTCIITLLTLILISSISFCMNNKQRKILETILLTIGFKG
jgi:hypothetical protein